MPPFPPCPTEYASIQPDKQALRIGLQHDPRWAMPWLPDALRAEGFDVISSPRPERFIQLVQSNAVDLALLANGPSAVDGFAVLDWLRSHVSETLPIVLLIAEHDAERVVQGLERGADDVLSAGMGQRELMARIKAHATRYQPPSTPANALRHGMYTLELESRCMRIGSGAQADVVRLSSREFILMLHLFENLGRVVSKDTLIARIWGEADRRFDPTLCTYISKLRKSLHLRAGNGLIVSTVYGHGYRLERVPIPHTARRLTPRHTLMSLPDAPAHTFRAP